VRLPTLPCPGAPRRICWPFRPYLSYGYAPAASPPLPLLPLPQTMPNIIEGDLTLPVRFLVHVLTIISPPIYRQGVFSFSPWESFLTGSVTPTFLRPGECLSKISLGDDHPPHLAAREMTYSLSPLEPPPSPDTIWRGFLFLLPLRPADYGTVFQLFYTLCVG